VTRVRFFPRPGHADRMARGRLTGSNESQTNAFDTLAEITARRPRAGGRRSFWKSPFVIAT
jgi:hypothetical protein